MEAAAVSAGRQEQVRQQASPSAVVSDLKKKATRLPTDQRVQQFDVLIHPKSRSVFYILSLFRDFGV